MFKRATEKKAENGTGIGNGVENGNGNGKWETGTENRNGNLCKKLHSFFTNRTRDD